MPYTEPSWARAPITKQDDNNNNNGDWYLIEIKSGVEVAKHALHPRPCTVFGRATDMVHIPLCHESASRQHARIAFDSNGHPWLRDLASTHGTTVNKRKLPPPAIGKVESNSQIIVGARGVMLFPGDVLRFGASSRIYCLEGPATFERGAIKAKQAAAAATAATAVLLQQQLDTQMATNTEQAQSNPKNENNGVSWGIAMDDHDDDDDRDAHNSSSNNNHKSLPMELENVPEKHRKAFERLNAMKYKLANLETEDGRIRNKGELTDGQEKQLQRNAEREETLKNSIVDLEEDLYDKLYPDDTQTNKKKKKKRTAVDTFSREEEDDFFDRTQKNKDNDETNGVSQEGESESTLVQKWKNVNQLQQDCETQTLPQAQDQVSALVAKVTRLQARGDDEEAFFVQNDLDLAKETLEKLKRQQVRHQQTLKEIERLLKIVNPKIQYKRESSYIGEGPPSPLKEPATEESSTAMMLPPPAKRPQEQRMEDVVVIGDSSMPPPPIVQTSFGGDDNNSSEFIMPPPKRKRVAGPSMPPPPPSVGPSMPPPPPSVGPSMPPPNPSVGPSMPPPPPSVGPSMPPPSKPGVVVPSMPPPATFAMKSGSLQKEPAQPAPDFKRPASTTGTLAFIASMTQKEENTGLKPSSSPVPKKVQKTVIDPKKDEWRAPQGQDGSGMTKLNAKFAGRY